MITREDRRILSTLRDAFQLEAEKNNEHRETATETASALNRVLEVTLMRDKEMFGAQGNTDYTPN